MNYTDINNRFLVGFDKVAKQLTDMAEHTAKITSNYPPYNIKKVDDNKYVIEMAVAGFGKQDIELQLDGDKLIIKGQVASGDEMLEGNMNFPHYEYKGISERPFTRQFTLADNVEIRSADLLNGMLKVWLEAIIPDSKKPRKIEINSDPKSEPEFLRETKKSL